MHSTLPSTDTYISPCVGRVWYSPGPGTSDPQSLKVLCDLEKVNLGPFSGLGRS